MSLISVEFLLKGEIPPPPGALPGGEQKQVFSDISLVAHCQGCLNHMSANTEELQSVTSDSTMSDHRVTLLGLKQTGVKGPSIQEPIRSQ